MTRPGSYEDIRSSRVHASSISFPANNYQPYSNAPNAMGIAQCESQTSGGIFGLFTKWIPRRPSQGFWNSLAPRIPPARLLHKSTVPQHRIFSKLRVHLRIKTNLSSQPWRMSGPRGVKSRCPTHQPVLGLCVRFTRLTASKRPLHPGTKKALARSNLSVYIRSHHHTHLPPRGITPIPLACLSSASVYATE